MGILAHHIFKSFWPHHTPVLKDISFTIQSGEFVALTGRSGSGKSTLLYILSSLDAPTSGSVLINNTDIRTLNQTQIHQFRNQSLGFVFQFHYLLPELTALENILMPARKNGDYRTYLDWAMHLLDQFELSNKTHQLSTELSGGEQQRVAIARALIKKPEFLFADEPTGNLDSKNAETVLNLFSMVNREYNTSIVMVTHDAGYAAQAHRQIVLKDGQLGLRS